MSGHTNVRTLIHTHTQLRTQFSAVFCFSPFAFSITFVLTRSVRQLTTAPPTTYALSLFVYFTCVLIVPLVTPFRVALNANSSTDAKSATLLLKCKIENCF